MNHYPQGLQEFLLEQQVMALATHSGQPWVSNLYYVTDGEGLIYFVSHKQTAHSKHIHLHPEVAFSIAWYAPGHVTDRRIIQGQGMCRILVEKEDICPVVHLHNEKFPDFTQYVTEALCLPKCSLGVYCITPTMMKYGDGHYLDGRKDGEVWIH